VNGQLPPPLLSKRRESRKNKKLGIGKKEEHGRRNCEGTQK